MNQQTGHLKDRYHAQIILLLLCTMKLFCIFFANQFFKNIFLRSGVSESCSPVSGALKV